MVAALRKVAALAIVVLLLLGLAKAADSMMRYSRDQFAHYQTPYAVPLPYGQQTDALAKQVIVVIAGGLRLDTSQGMPELNRLRRMGADFVSTAGQPSLSVPAWTAIFSGADHEISGVTTDAYEDAVKVDSLFAEAKHRQLATAVVGSPLWLKLFGAAIDYSQTRGPDRSSDKNGSDDIDSLNVDSALSILQSKHPDLMVIQLQASDQAGRSFGGITAEYRNAALVTDALLGLLLKEVDLSQTTLVLTSDHGHLDSGGSGGGEAVVIRTPLVMAGKGIKPGGAPKEVAQTDIAPTIAVLLGIPIPVHNRGRALLEALDAPPTLKGQQGLAVAQELAVFYDAYAGQLGAKPFAQSLLATAQPNIATGEALALADFQQNLMKQGQAFRAARIDGERTLRIPLAALVLILVAGYFWRARHQHNFKLALLGAVVYFAADNGAFFARGYHYSLSVVNGEANLAGFLNERGSDALVSIVVAVIVVAVFARHEPLWRTVTTVVHTCLLIAYLLVAQVALFFALYGFSFPWYIPDLSLGFKFYLDLLRISATVWPVNYLPLSLGLPFLGLIARLVAGFVDYLRQPRGQSEPEPS